MNYNVTICTLCNEVLSLKQVREAVYWLPDMTDLELRWAAWDGLEHKFAHRLCWKKLREKRREAIRLYSFHGEEPRSMGQQV